MRSGTRSSRASAVRASARGPWPRVSRRGAGTPCRKIPTHRHPQGHSRGSLKGHENWPLRPTRRGGSHRHLGGGRFPRLSAGARASSPRAISRTLSRRAAGVLVSPRRRALEPDPWGSPVPGGGGPAGGTVKAHAVCREKCARAFAVRGERAAQPFAPTL